jgi:cytochrome c553
VNLPEWERLLWQGRPWRPAQRYGRERYLLTDFRLVRLVGDDADEIALDDITDVGRTETRLDRVLGTSTLAVHGRRGSALVLVSVRRGQQLAALLELLAGDPRAPRDAETTRSALAWNPRSPAIDLRQALGSVIAVLIAIFAVVIGLHGKTAAVSYAPDDAIAPGGEKRSAADIIAFMEHDVLPWARRTLGPIKGGAERITCGTCHGEHADARDWQMPAVAALPQPEVRDRGWETYTSTMDAQMRNAIYGYIAESDNQAKAAYMREVVVPGMARLLHRPAYDFTKSYEFNRSRRALGCYHCHRVK